MAHAVPPLSVCTMATDYSINIGLNPVLDVTAFNAILVSIKTALGDLGKGISFIDPAAFTQAKTGAKSLGDEIEGVAKKTKGAKEQADGFGSAFRFNEAVQSVRNVAAAVSELSAPYLSFNQALQDVSAITGLTGQNLDALGDAARRNAIEFGTSATDQLDAYKGILSRIGPQLADTPDKLDAVSRSINTLSAASGDSAAQSMDALTTSLLQFGVDVNNANEVALKSAEFTDVLAKSAQVGSAEIPQVAEAVKQAGVAAKSANLSFQEVNAAIQVLGSGGKYGSEAGIALRNVLGKLQDQSGEGAKQLAKMGTSTKELGQILTTQGLGPALAKLQEGFNKLGSDAEKNAASFTLFGTENAAAAGILLNGAETMKEWTVEVGKSGAAQEQANARMQSAQSIMARLKARVEDALIGTFQAIGPAVTGGLNAIAQVAPTISTIVGLKNIIPAGATSGIINFAKSLLVTLVPSLATSGAMAGTTAFSFSAMWTAITGPVALVIAGIAAVGAAIYLLYTNVEPVRKFIDEAWVSIKEFATGLYESVVGAFTSAWDAVSKFAVGLYETLQPALATAWDILKGVGAFLVDVLVLQFQIWWETISTVASVLAAVLTPVLETLWSLLSGLGGFLVSVFVPAWDFLQTAFNAIAGAVTQYIVPAFDFLLTIFSTIGAWIQDQVVPAFDNLMALLSEAASLVVDVVGAAFEVLWSILTGLMGFIVDVVIATISELWDILTAIAGVIVDVVVVAFNAFWSVVTTAYDALASLVEWISDGVSSLLGLQETTDGTSIVMKAWEAVVSGVSGVLNFFRSVLTNVGGAIDYVRSVVAGLSSVFQSVKDTVAAVADAISSLDFSSALDAVTSFFGGVGDAYEKGFNQKAQQIAGQNLIQGVLDSQISSLTQQKEQYEQAIKDSKLKGDELVRFTNGMAQRLADSRAESQRLLLAKVAETQGLSPEEKDGLSKKVVDMLKQFSIATKEEGAKEQNKPALPSPALSAKGRAATKAAGAAAALDFTDEYRKVLAQNFADQSSLAVKQIADQRKREEEETKKRIQEKINGVQEEYNKLRDSIEKNAQEKKPKPIKLTVYEVDAAGNLKATEQVISDGQKALALLGEQFELRKKLIADSETQALNARFAKDDLAEFLKAEATKTAYLNQASKDRITLLEQEAKQSGEAFRKLQSEQAAAFKVEQAAALRAFVEGTAEFASQRAVIQAQVEVGQVKAEDALVQIEQLRKTIAESLTVGVNVDPATAEAWKAMLAKLAAASKEFEEQQRQEAERTRINAITDLAERERELAIASARAQWQARLKEAAGNEALEREAFTDFMEAKTKAERDFLRRSNSISAQYQNLWMTAAEEISKAFDQVFNGRVDDEETAKLREQLQAEEDALFASLAAREIGYEEYASKIEELNEKLRGIEEKSLNFWEGAAEAFRIAGIETFKALETEANERLGKSIQQLSAQMTAAAAGISASGSATAADWEAIGTSIQNVAVEAAGVALASFGRMVAEGKPVLKAFGVAVAETAIQTVTTIVNSNIPAIFSTAMGLLGPIAGVVAATGAVALVNGLLAVAKASLPKFHTGGISHDEQLAVLLKNEAVIAPQPTRVFEDEIRMMNAGITRRELREHFIREERSTNTTALADASAIERLDARLAAIERAQQSVAKRFSHHQRLDVRISTDHDALLRKVDAERYAALG